MARSDRLAAIVALMEDGRRRSGDEIARWAGVALRTIYRDMEVLRAGGVDVEGTRGSGFRLAPSHAMPPVRVTPTELEALQLGLAVLAEAEDEELRTAARSLAEKFAMASGGAPVAAPPRLLPVLRTALRARQKLSIAGAGEADARRRIVRPLKLDYDGVGWRLIVWCETSGAFRRLRVEGLAAVEPLPDLFSDDPGRGLEDLRALEDLRGVEDIDGRPARER